MAKARVQSEKEANNRARARKNYAENTAPQKTKSEFISIVSQTERIIAEKVKTGVASDLDKKKYSIYQKLAQKRLPDISEISAGITDYEKKYNDSVSGYKKDEEYEGVIKQGSELKRKLFNYSEYAELYDTKNYDLFNGLYKEIGSTIKSVENRKGLFKNQYEYEAGQKSAALKTYSDYRQVLGGLQRRKGTGTKEDDARIDAQLNWLKTNGLNNQAVLKSMTDDDWEYEMGQLDAQSQQYYSPAFERDYINKRINNGMSYEDAKAEFDNKVEKINNDYAKYKEYNRAFNNMKKSEVASNIEDIVMKNDDFDSNISFNISADNAGASENTAYAVYYARELEKDKWIPRPSWWNAEYDSYRYMSDYQRNVFFYLYNTEGEEKAEEYLENIKPELNSRYREKEVSKAYEFGQKHPYLSVAGNALDAVVEGIYSPIENVKNVFSVQEIDPYAPETASHYAHSARVQGGSNQFESRAGKLIYNAANSIAEMTAIMATSKFMGGKIGGLNTSLVNKATSTINSIMNSSRVMKDTTLRYKENGESDINAVSMGIINGIIEYLTEKWSMENILKTPDILKEASTIKKFGAYALKFAKDFASEGSEEVSSSILQSLAAFITANRENDEFLTVIDNAKANGLGNGEAFVEAVKEFAPQYFEEFVIGGIAGGMFGSVNTYQTVTVSNKFRNLSYAHFKENGTERANITKFLIDNGIADETELATITNGIMNMAQGKTINKETQTKIKENPLYRGVLYGYTDIKEYNQSKEKSTVLNAESENKAVTSEQIISTMDSTFSGSRKGRAGSQVYNDEIGIGSGNFVKTLVLEGYSESEAQEKADLVFGFMYEQGAKGRNLQKAVEAVSENIISGFDKTAELFYTAGKIDAANQMNGKKSAKLVNNAVLKSMYKANEISHKTARAINAIASKLGVDVEFVDSIDGGHNALFDTKTGKLQISRQSKKPFVTAAIHESVHAIRSIDSKSYNELKDITYKVLSQNKTAYKGAWAETYSIYKKEATDQDGKLNKDYISEEMTSEVISQLLTDEDFVNELAKTDRNLVQRIFDIIADFFDKAIGRYTDNKNNISAEMKEAVKELQNEFDNIKKMYNNALSTTEAKRGVNMVLPKSLEKQNNILYNKKWHTDLTQTQIKEVVKSLRKAGNPEATRITDTANWYKGRIDGKDLFVIYSTVYANEPTILYEVKGVNASRELDILQIILEVIEDGESVIGIQRNIDRLLGGDWVQKKHDMANNNDRPRGRGSNTGYAPILQGKSPEFIGSPAFREVVRNLFEIQYGKINDGKNEENVRHSKNKVNDLENTEQFRVMWTIEEGILSSGEVKEFYDLIGDKKRGMFFPQSFDGDYIIEVNDKLIFANADYLYPSISKVIAINDADLGIVEDCKEVIIDGETNGIESAENIEFAEALYGEGIITSADFVDSEAYRREKDSRRKGVGGGTSNNGSEEDVKLSKNGGTFIDEDIEPPVEVTSEEINANVFKLKKEIRDKLDKHIEKYGKLEEGVNPVRKVNLPKKTDDGRFVRRGTRTVIESEKVTNEIAEKLTEEIANGEFWTTYERAGNQKAQDTAFMRLRREGFDALYNEWKAIIESGKAIDKQDIVNAQLLMEEAAKEGNTQLVVDIVSDISAEATRAGQLVQSMLMLKKLGTAANIRKIQNVVKSLQKDLDKKFGRKAPDLEIPKDLLDEFAEVFEREHKAGDNDHSASDEIVDKIYEAVAKQVPTSWEMKFNTWRYFAMLGNFRTHIRNFFGNLVFQPAIFIKNLTAASLEGTTAAALKLAGKDMNRTKTIKGVLQGTFKQGAYKYAVKDALKIEKVLKGESKYGETDKILQKVEVYKKLKFLNKWTDTNSKWLEKEDWFFLKRHYARALTMYMNARNLTVENITDKQLELARKYAIKEAQKATYRDESAMALTLSLMSKRNKGLGIIVDSLLPFKKTPINILKRGIEYSPAGIGKSLTKGIYDLKKGKITAAEFLDGLGANLTGSGILALGMFFASQGMLTGPGDDEEENKIEQLIGVQNYSFKIGDSTYTIDWLSPAAMCLFVGCEMWRALDDGSVSFADIGNALPRITEPLFDMSMLEGLTSILGRTSFVDSDAAKGAELFLAVPSNYIGQFVPTILGQTARTIDPVRRKTYINKNSNVPQWVQSFAQQQAKKIPFIHSALAPYINAKGESELNAEGNILLRAFQNYLSPGYYKKIKSNDVDEEISRLYDAEGENAKGIIPKIVEKSITIEGDKVYLSDEQYTSYQQTTGQTYYELLNRIVSSSYYNSLSDEMQIDIFEKVKEFSVEIGKEAALPQYESDTKWVNTAKRMSQSEQAQYMYGRVLAADDNGNELIINDKFISNDVKMELLNYGWGKSDTPRQRYDDAGLEKYNISSDIFIDAYAKYQSFEEYKNQYGRNVSKKKQFCQYLGSLNISNIDKSAIYRAFYNDRTENGKPNIKEVTWKYVWE